MPLLRIAQTDAQRKTTLEDVMWVFGLKVYEKYTELNAREIFTAVEITDVINFMFKFLEDMSVSGSSKNRFLSRGRTCQESKVTFTKAGTSSVRHPTRSEQDQAGNSGRLHQDKTCGCPWGSDVRIL